MSVRGLKSRLSRLEDRLRKKRTGAPTRAEFDDAATRQRTRNAYSSRLKLWQMSGWDEEELWGSFTHEDLAMLDADTDEQRRKDEDVMRRYQKASGADDDSESSAGIAERVRQKLRGMVRLGDGGASQ